MRFLQSASMRHQINWQLDKKYRIFWYFILQCFAILSGIMFIYIPSLENEQQNIPFVKSLSPETKATGASGENKKPINKDDYSKCMNSNLAYLDRGNACNKLILAESLSGEDLSRAYFGRGWSEENQRLFNEAVSDYSKSIEIHPNKYAYLNRANLYRSPLKQWSQAIDDARMAIAFDGRYGNAYAVLGATYKDLGDDISALFNLNKALTINPSDGWSLYHRGDTYLMRGELDLAISDFSHGMIFNDKNSEKFYVGRSKAEYLNGQKSEARQDFMSALSINRNSPYVSDGFSWFMKNSDHMFMRCLTLPSGSTGSNKPIEDAECH